MKNILIQQGIKIALLGKEKKPEKMNADEWADVDERAMSSIEQYLSDEVMFNVMLEKSAKDLWEKLEKLYMGKNLTNKLHLKKQLYGLKMEEGCDLMEHMNTFNRMISDLLRLDVKMKIDNKGKEPVQSQTGASTSGGEEEVEVQQEPTSLAQGIAKRNIKPPQRFGWDEDEVHFALITSNGDPTTLQEAMESNEREAKYLEDVNLFGKIDVYAVATLINDPSSEQQPTSVHKDG
ncbi:hypothetical protein MRB53_035180 [Persea americana]|uniref:Uncharacterized protein n=1 Tax=Persea americana TaxID=3435 RepID=A0ACC2K4G9_PERAE|nr:hypothetical protein MRB53_035180 [Persea americana]